MAGVLYIVPTPIGNLEDITERARRVLGQVAIIAAEDTRRCRKLLQLLDIPVPRVIALHEHNEATAAGGVLNLLVEGQDVALVSDAGTPLLSDPGHLLLRQLWARTDTTDPIQVVPLPGASAITTLLCACPLPLTQFSFEGFLPAKAQHKKQRLKALLGAQSATVIFEAPHRIESTLSSIAELAPERRVFVGRELTKLHESLRLGTAVDLLARMRTDATQKGEFVLVIEGSGADTKESLPQVQRLIEVIGEEIPPAQTARLVAKITGRTKSEIYDLAMALSISRNAD